MRDSHAVSTIDDGGGDAGIPDGGQTRDAGETRDGGGRPDCGSDPWATYAHDERRTSASDACITGPLTSQWRYAPSEANAVFHAIAQNDAVFLQWRGPDPPYLGTTVVDRISLAGGTEWSFRSGTDTNMGNWPSLAFGAVVVNDDGLYYLDAQTGNLLRTNGVDWWGQTAPDGTRLYVVNNVHVDGPGLGVGAYDEGAAQLWRQNEFGICRIDAADRIGALAVDSSLLFYAAQYATGQGVILPFESGLYAFEAESGALRWYQSTVPRSAISAASGNLYGVEAGDLVVARSQTDGAQSWTALVPGVGPQAPLLADGKVIVASFSNVTAFDASTGEPRWDVNLLGAAGLATYVTFSGGCAGLLSQGGAIRSTLAAALGSGTLVVTTGSQIHILSLADGSETWSGTVPLAIGNVHDPALVGNQVYVIDSGDFMNPAGVISMRSP